MKSHALHIELHSSQPNLIGLRVVIQTYVAVSLAVNKLTLITVILLSVAFLAL